MNVTTKSGTNAFHGTAYEFNRVSALASNGFNNNALGLPKSNFDRNQFGYSVGGPIKKNKLFFFNNTEWTRVRSSGQLPAPDSGSGADRGVRADTQGSFPHTANWPQRPVLETFNRTQLATLGTDPCGGGPPTAHAWPRSQRADVRPGELQRAERCGAGSSAEYLHPVGRVDYNLNDKTQIYTRYALYSETILPGTISNSPYDGFNTGHTTFYNSLIVSMTHTFTSTFVSQSKLDFNRFNGAQPLSSTGVTPNYYLGNAKRSIGIGLITWPAGLCTL